MFRLTNNEVWLLVQMLKSYRTPHGIASWVQEHLLERLQAELQARNDADYDLKDDDGDDNILEDMNVRP